MAPHVFIELEDKKPRPLRYDHNAVADLEELCGFGLGSLLAERKMAFHGLRLLVWAGLKWRDRTMTPQKAGDLIQTFVTRGGKLTEVQEKCLQALEQAGCIELRKPTDDELAEDAEAEIEGGPGNEQPGETETTSPGSASVTG